MLSLARITPVDAPTDTLAPGLYALTRMDRVLFTLRLLRPTPSEDVRDILLDACVPTS